MTPPQEPIPISALQHVIYCLRQAALIHLEQLWADNRFTAEGEVLHAVADKGGRRHVRGVRRVMSLPLSSQRLGITGVADVVEFLADEEGERPFPIEYKRGKPKRHRADEVQLCAQALCLEEMTGATIPEGALFYGQTRHRVIVPFDADLRQLTETAIQDLADVLTSGKTPPPTQDKSRCRACSLSDLCRPDVVGRSARQWRDRMLDRVLADQ